MRYLTLFRTCFRKFSGVCDLAKSNSPLRVVYFNSVKCALDFNYIYQRNNKKNVITIHITKRLSHFGKVTMSVGKTIDELLFGENEKKS